MSVRKIIIGVVLFFSLLGFCMTMAHFTYIFTGMEKLIIPAVLVGGLLWVLTDPLYIIELEEELEREENRTAAAHALARSALDAKEKNERKLRAEIERLKREREEKGQ